MRVWRTAEPWKRLQLGESSSSDARRTRCSHARSLHRIRRSGPDTAVVTTVTPEHTTHERRVVGRTVRVSDGRPDTAGIHVLVDRSLAGVRLVHDRRPRAY